VKKDNKKRNKNVSESENVCETRKVTIFFDEELRNREEGDYLNRIVLLYEDKFSYNNIDI
jgi:hypothetical protein